jgi:hypothetical protein
MIHFSCPYCKAELKVGNLKTGRRLRCPKCKASFESPPKRKRTTFLLAGLAGCGLLCTAALVVIVVANKPKPSLPDAALRQPETHPPGAPKHEATTRKALKPDALEAGSGGSQVPQTWTPASSADFQAALQRALPGDTIILQAGQTYRGNFSLNIHGGAPGKPITIRSSALSDLPPLNPAAPWDPRQRVNPTLHAQYMPKIVADVTPATGTTFPALYSSSPVSYLYFRGIEITALFDQTSQAANRELIYLVWIDGKKYTADGSGDSAISTFAEQPSHITFDQCYIHGVDQSQIRHGVRMEGAFMSLTNSWIGNIKSVANDSSAFNAENSTGPFIFVNTYFEACTETIIFGGGTRSWNVIPGQLKDPATGYGIRIQYCTIAKNPQWNPLWSTYVPPDPKVFPAATADSRWAVKNLLEFKNGENALIDHNLFQYSWVGQQEGAPIVVNLTSYYYRDAHNGGSPESTAAYEQVRHILVTNNIFDSVPHGPTIAYAPESPIRPQNTGSGSQLITDIVIRNNLFTHFGWQYGYAEIKVPVPVSSWKSTGRNTASTLVDATQNWRTNQWVTLYGISAWSVTILDGKGAGQTKTVAANTSNTITIQGTWATIPDSTSTYMLTHGSLTRGSLLLCHSAGVAMDHNTFRMDPKGFYVGSGTQYCNMSVFLYTGGGSKFGNTTLPFFERGVCSQASTITDHVLDLSRGTTTPVESRHPGFACANNIAPTGNSYTFDILGADGIYHVNDIKYFNVAFPDIRLEGNVLYGVPSTYGVGNIFSPSPPGHANNTYDSATTVNGGADFSEARLGFTGPASIDNYGASSKLSTSSPYKGKGYTNGVLDGTDPGCNVDLLAPTAASK